MTEAPTALARLIGDPAEFLTTVFGRAPVHRRAADTDTVLDLLTLADVDHIVAGSGVRAPAFRLVRAGQTLPRAGVTRRARIGSRPVDDLIDVAAVHREFRDGATIVLQGLHRSWPAVGALCRSLEAELTHPVQANAYLTPPVAQGLDLHADAHDVFVLQTHGVKRWVVHPPDGGHAWDLDVAPGDVLYLPAGTRHAAQTIDRPSLHLTIGVRTVGRRDLLRRIVEEHLADTAFDGALTGGWAEDPAATRDTARDDLAALVARLEGADPAPAVTAAAASFWTGRVPDRTGGLLDALEMDLVDDDTWLRRRVDATARLTTDGDGVVLHLGDRRLHLPSAAGPALRDLLGRTHLRPCDLADHADGASRQVLCRRLLLEGLLTIDRDRA